MINIKSIGFSVFTLTFILNFNLSSMAQLTLRDYQRAQSFTYKEINNTSAFNIYMRQNFFEDSTGLWQVFHDDKSKSYQVVWFDELKRKPLFDHQKVAEQLSILLKDTLDKNDLSLEIEKKSKNQLEISTSGRYFNIDLTNSEVKEIEKPSSSTENKKESISPDSSRTAYSKAFNLYLKDQSGNEQQLSSEGKENYEFGSYYGWYDLMQGENGKRPENFSVHWSNDSKYLWTNICDLRSANKMYLLDWSVDTLFRPQLYSYYRGSPGDTAMVYETPVFYNAKTGKEIGERLPRRTHINSYWIEWIEGKDQTLIVDSERGYHKLNFYSMDLKSGKRELLFTEESETRVGNKLEIEMFSNANTFIFTSERSGWNHLYTYDLKNKKVKPLTNGEYVVNKMVNIDTNKNLIYFLASGKDKDMNPYHQQLYSIDLNGKSLKLLTPEPINHEINFAPNNQFFVDKISSIATPSKYVLRSAENGEILADLGATDITQLIEKNWKAPVPFEAIGRDGTTKIYGALWKPTNFDPNKKYPIIDNTYTGPHTQMFPQTFGEAFWDHQALAELGFIVMKVDGMGTNGRSKAFQDVSYKNMGNNLVDHIGAIRQLSKKYSWLDTTRVGIYGHSAGGFDTGHALLAFPDFYKVGVASSADHDFRMEKAWWPEMYMGWPVDSSYHAVSNITMAPNLKGKLLIVHGGMDENVNPSATFKLAEALIKANKDFDMLIMPSQHHGYKGAFRDYFNKKRWNYFVEHLLGAEPIWDFE